MNGNHTFTYDLATFSAEGAVPGPCAQLRDPAAEYVAQRMADQHRGGLSPAHWRAEADRLLSRADQDPGVPHRRCVLRARGVSVTSFPATAAAVFGVELVPIFDDEGPVAAIACAAASHPRLSVAMGEAGLRAEHWLSHRAGSVGVAEERGPLVGFEAAVDARLLAPLRALPDPGLRSAGDGPPLRAA